MFDSDAADVDVIVPAVDIEKTPDTQQVVSGADATFTITVTNTGDVVLDGPFTVTDSHTTVTCPADTTLAVGNSITCTSCGKCVAVCPTGSLHYQGSAVGEMRHHPDLRWLDFLEGKAPAYPLEAFQDGLEEVRLPLAGPSRYGRWEEES